MKWFLLITFSSLLVWADTSKVSEIVDPDIVCENPKEDFQVSINTNTGKIWFKAVSDRGNLGFHAMGAVWSGIHSPTKFHGEVLAELHFNNIPMYITIIIRDINGKPQMETWMHKIANGNDYRKIMLDDCSLKL